MVCAQTRLGDTTMQRRELETAAANYSYLRGLLYIPSAAVRPGGAGQLAGRPVPPHWVFLLVAWRSGPSPCHHRYYNEQLRRLTPSTASRSRAASASSSRWR
jgi:hypothetical protein